MMSDANIQRQSPMDDKQLQIAERGQVECHGTLLHNDGVVAEFTLPSDVFNVSEFLPPQESVQTILTYQCLCF
jgi:hypothetical protein